MTIHIGQVIKKTLKTKDISVADFAHKINYTRGNAYKIFNKKTIDTGLLIKINEVLGENLFFKFISDEEIEIKVEEKVKTVLSLKAWKEFIGSVNDAKKVAKGKSKVAAKKTLVKKKK